MNQNPVFSIASSITPEMLDKVSRHVSVAALSRRQRNMQCEKEENMGLGLYDRVLASRMEENESKKPQERGGAFAVLSDEDLSALDQILAWKKRGEKRTFTVLSDTDDRPELLVNALRVNHLVKPGTLSPATFRAITRSLLHHMLDHVHHHSFAPFSPGPASDIVAVLPWRAGLVFGEAYVAQGTTNFWHIGVSRDEHTLLPKVYYTAPPKAETKGLPHVVGDPMLATGGTTGTAVEIVLRAGVRPEDVTVFSIIAAPEGVHRLLTKFPGIRVMTCVLDERLNKRGFIVPGLGDFGDQAYNDLTPELAEQLWVRPGLLTAEEAAIILRRMKRL